MSKILLLNLGANLVLTLFFVVMNIRALELGLEETFIALALLFGLIETVFNALFLLSVQKKQPWVGPELFRKIKFLLLRNSRRGRGLR